MYLAEDFRARKGKESLYEDVDKDFRLGLAPFFSGLNP